MTGNYFCLPPWLDNMPSKDIGSTGTESEKRAFLQSSRKVEHVTGMVANGLDSFISVALYKLFKTLAAVTTNCSELGKEKAAKLKVLEEVASVPMTRSAFGHELLSLVWMMAFITTHTMHDESVEDDMSDSSGEDSDNNFSLNKSVKDDDSTDIYRRFRPFEREHAQGCQVVVSVDGNSVQPY